jgi:hypothetical protein
MATRSPVQYLGTAHRNMVAIASSMNVPTSLALPASDIAA